MKRDKGTGFVAVFIALLLAVTMIPAAGMQTAFADEPAERPATESGDVALEGATDGGAAADDAASGVVAATVREDGSLVAEGLVYSVVDGGAVLVGFEDGNALEDSVAVPECLSDGTNEYAVTGVDVAEGQAAPSVKALALPQTVEDINTKSLAEAMPGLAAINVDGTAGAYSSANGLLFKQADEAASSDGSTVRVANRELLWTPPATVIARIPGTCKRVAAGTFTDAKALETIMAFSTVESIARPGKDAEGNLIKEGAFTDEQVGRVNIVIPISATIQPEGEGRISADVFLSEQVGLDVKQTPWCDYGFDIKRFTVGIPCGSTSVTVAVPEDGVVETPVITVGDYVGYPQWNPKPGEVDWPADGLVFEYKADMTVSVRWDGNKDAIPSRLELPAYVIENGVKTAVTEVAPNAFEGAAQLESVVVPEGVTTIGESAFAGCSGLKSVSLPSTLKTIDYAAFKGTGLESVEIPSAVRWIGGEAFDEGVSLGDLQMDTDLFVSEGILNNSNASLIPSASRTSTAPSGTGEYESEGVGAYSVSGRSIRIQLKDKPVNYTVGYRYGTAAHATDSWTGYGINPAIRGDFSPYVGVIEESSFSYVHTHNYPPTHEPNHIITITDYKDTSIPAGQSDIFEAPGNSYFFRAFPLGDNAADTSLDFTIGLIGDDGVDRTNSNPNGYNRWPNWNLTWGNVSVVTVAMSDVTVSFDAGTSEAFESQGYLNSQGNTYVYLPTPTIAPSEGLRFAGWKNAVGQIVTEDSNNTGVSHTLIAVWKRDHVDSTVAVGGHGTGVSLDVPLGSPYGSSATLDAGTFAVSKDYFGSDKPVEAYAKLDGDKNLLVYPSEADANDGTNLGATLKVAPEAGYHCDGWTLDGTAIPADAAVKIDNTKTHALACSFAATEHTLTLVGGGGASFDGAGGSKTVGYRTGDVVELPKDAKLNGFWLKGWVWSNDGTGFDSVKEPTFSLSTSSSMYGDATLKAVWVPQTYVAEYNVAEAGKKADGSAMAATPDPTTLVSSDAVTAVDTLEDKGELLYQWDTAFTSQRAYIDSVANKAWIDTAGVTSDAAHAVDLAGKPDADGKSSLDLDGFAFMGWTADSTKKAFNPSTLPTDTTYTLDGDKMQHAFSSVWNKTHTQDEAAQNKVTLYAIWQNRTMDSGGIVLTLDEPTNVNNEGTAIAKLDSRGVTDQAGKKPGEEGYAAPTQKILYWQGRGLLSVAEANAISTNSPTRKTAGDIDAGMKLVAPARYGFEFLGWGKAGYSATEPEKATLYVSYNEANNKFALTEAGAALMKGEVNGTDPAADCNGDLAVIADAKWVPVWKIRTIEVSLRIPTHAVSDVDVTGVSTGADRAAVDEGDKPLHPGATKVQYTFTKEADGSEADTVYAWREGTSAETGNGSTSGWLIAKRAWSYGDLLEYPAFSQQKDRYTYDGWYDIAKPSTTDSTDKALEDMAAKSQPVRRVLGFNALRATSTVHVSGAWADGKDLGLDIDDKFFLTGDTSGLDGTRGMTVKDGGLSKELWLWTSPIRINVASPMGVYLCTTNSYGQAVEPYVVGNDRRTQLEAQAEFSVSTSSHDLQLVDVTAEDVTFVKRDEAGNVVDEEEGDIQSQAGLSDKGICNQILTPKFPSNGDNYYYDGAADPENYDESGKEVAADKWDKNEGSRMFWVSPVPTATADQTGVIYESDTVTAKSAATAVDATSKMTSEEALLHPDVASRRYFGFGHNNDDTIADHLDSAVSDKEYKLGDFVLRKDYADAAEGSASRRTDGLARTAVAKDVAGKVTSTSYRFYYGLDMRRADFNLTGLQKLIDNSGGALGYDSAFDQPLLRVKFTFAAARNDGISYYSMALADNEAAARANAYDAAAEAAGDGVDEATEITAGAPAVLR